RSRGPRRASCWTVAGVAALWALSIAAAGVPLHEAYVRRVLSIGHVVLVSFNNQSLSAVLGRMQLPHVAWFDWRMYHPGAALAVIHAAILGVIAVSAVASVARLPRERPERWRPLAEDFELVFMMLEPNIAWTHTLVFLFLVLTVCC